MKVPLDVFMKAGADLAESPSWGDVATRSRAGTTNGPKWANTHVKPHAKSIPSVTTSE